MANSIRDGIKPGISMFTNIELIKEEDKPYIKISVKEIFNDR